MCGIVGYVGERDAVDVIFAGLKRLEYRGYDSAGLSVLKNGTLGTVHTVGKLVALNEKLKKGTLSGNLGIGHTRWATHGVPSESNAHPHLDENGEIALVHNGIIENYKQLREKLRNKGVTFKSDTDSETLAHLVRSHYSGDLFDATKRAMREVQGAYAIAVICKDNPDVLVAARKGSPLIVALGDGEGLVASDASAVIKYTRKVVYLDDGQVCEVTRRGCTVHDLDGHPQDVTVHSVDWDDSAAQKDGYPHFMLKEIFEQPDSLANTMRGRVTAGNSTINLDDLELDPEAVKRCDKLVLVACGTAWHACLIGKYLIERIVGLPVEVDIASEYRYREPLVPPNTIVVPVTQSGETADSLEAIRVAKQKGAKILSIVNVVGSSIARESDHVLYLQAGPEIGVASTKAYTSQITALCMLAIHFAVIRGAQSKQEIATLIAHLLEIPAKVQSCLDNHSLVEKCAAEAKYRDALSAYFLGRGYNYPNALEGALKLKEISYIHAEGFRAGEMKHGPIALVTDKLPVVCIAPRDGVYEKMISNIQEVKARNGIVLSIATVGDGDIADISDDIVYVPETFEPFSPIVIAVPLQLLAYYIAANRGCDVDQPRNLAKSVTVE